MAHADWWKVETLTPALSLLGEGVDEIVSRGAEEPSVMMAEEPKFIEPWAG